MRSSIIAHRGACAPTTHENTLEAFQNAIDLGADFVEFDIRRTKDRQMIVVHNPDIDGISIRSLTYREICSITAKQGYQIPLLKDVLALCKGKIKLDIELKESGYEQEVIHLVQRHFDYSEYMMKSFIDQCVLRIKEFDPNITAGLLIGTTRNTFIHRLNEYFPLRRLHACKADFISPYFKFLTWGFVWRMHLHNKPIYVWIVNSEKRIKHAFKHHADGIITDCPDYALKLRANLKKSKSRKES